MKKRMIWMLTLLCTVAQGIWAQTIVSTEKQLTDAIADGDKNIQLAGDILLSKYLDIDGKTVTGDLTGSTIGIDLENISGTFTSGWDGKNPSGIFTADFSNDLTVDLEGNEACVTTKNPVCYIERSWDATNKRVVSTEKRMVGFKIDGEDIPREGEYKEVTNAPGDSPNEWFRMGGYSNMTFSFI